MPSLPDIATHVMARRWEFGADADQALRALADGAVRPVTAWEVRECQICPRRPLHIYPRGSSEPVDWNAFARAGASVNPPSRAGRRGGARRG